MNKRIQIGFSQRIQLDWLEQTAQLLIIGTPKEQIREALQETLHNQLSIGGRAKRGNREKTISILMKIWITVPKGLEPLRDDGLKIIENLPKGSHLPVHWGMCMAVYPFFGVVAGTVGRLFKLQERISAAQVQRRIREQLGERETVFRAARRVIRCFTDWGVLKDTETKGVYMSGSLQPVKSTKILSWLVEAALISNGSSSIRLSSFSKHPAFFPFKLGLIGLAQIESNKRLTSFRHGLDEDMVCLGSSESSRKRL